ncbi:hypothetical protein AK51_14610 [Serratia nematodiphila DZ0503SBS1]|nr:hypothetical protein AK51_14610 [Serratia nematodiphila DZ0503SBS1]
MLPAADFYCLAGDPSSLPALAALLENLPPHGAGRAFVRVDSTADVIDLKNPPMLTSIGSSAAQRKPTN